MKEAPQKTRRSSGIGAALVIEPEENKRKKGNLLMLQDNEVESDEYGLP